MRVARGVVKKKGQKKEKKREEKTERRAMNDQEMKIVGDERGLLLPRTPFSRFTTIVNREGEEAGEVDGWNDENKGDPAGEPPRASVARSRVRKRRWGPANNAVALCLSLDSQK